MNDIQAMSLKRSSSSHSEYGFLGALAFLSILGFVAMWSASTGYALKLGLSASHFARRQVLFLIPTAVSFFVAYKIPLQALRGKIPLLAVLSLISLAAPFIPGLGVEINGGRRWINLGIMNFQPSELWKVMAVLYSAHILDKRKQTILASPVIYLQSDFSTSVLALVAPLAVFWLAGVSMVFFIGVLIPSLLAFFLMVASSEYRLTRVIGFIIPEFDPHGMNYQVQNSLRAIMSGGLFGKGLGLGTRKLSTIPEIQSDFVFAAFTEELGLLGVAAVALVWAYILFTVVRRLKGKSGFGSLLPLGLVFLLFIQFFVNLGVVSGFLPATGIALPFFSAGGSSLVTAAIASGLIANALRDEGFQAVDDKTETLEGVNHG
ncbi:MAG: cell division protein FtsW [Spirochaetes bacterium]|nr:MAG: cell division protein FtsW [Spirochaetota bacterium]